MKTFRRAFRTMTIASLLSLALALAPSAFAATILFDGPELGGQHWGMSQTTFNSIQSDFEVFEVNPMGFGPALEPMGGPYSITQGDVFDTDGNIFDAMDAMENPVFARSPWSAESNQNLDGRNFLVFATVMPTVASDPYVGPEVGLDILPEDGWVLLQTTPDMMGSVFYYAALLFEDFSDTDTLNFDINYNINRSLSFDPTENDFFFPQFGLSKLGPDAIVPEPGSALLIGLGLAGLAVRRKQTEV